MNCVDVLNQLLAIHNRSLPMYLHYAAPWVSRSDEAARDVCEQIVLSQREFVDRLGEMVLSEGGAVRFGEFPMSFTGLNDCGLAFLMPKIIEWQEKDVHLIERCVHELEGHPMAKALAQEALGAAKGHLDELKAVV